MHKYLLLYANYPIKLLFTKFADDGITPENYVAATYKAIICRDPDRKQPILTFAIGSGLSLVTNQIICSKNVNQNTLAPGNYFFDLRMDIDIDNGLPLIQLPVIVKPAAK